MCARWHAYTHRPGAAAPTHAEPRRGPGKPVLSIRRPARRPVYSATTRQRQAQAERVERRAKGTWYRGSYKVAGTAPPAARGRHASATRALRLGEAPQPRHTRKDAGLWPSMQADSAPSIYHCTGRFSRLRHHQRRIWRARHSWRVRDRSTPPYSRDRLHAARTRSPPWRRRLQPDRRPRPQPN